jgi:hypothetical protein
MNMLMPSAGWLAEIVSGLIPVLVRMVAIVCVRRYSETSVFVIVAYSSRSAVTVATAVPALLSSVPLRELVRFWITWPAERNPPSKQCPLVSIMARSVSAEVGKRTSEAEQLLRRIVAFRLGVTASACMVGAADAGTASRTVVTVAMPTRAEVRRNDRMCGSRHDVGPTSRMGTAGPRVRTGPEYRAAQSRRGSGLLRTGPAGRSPAPRLSTRFHT